MMADCVVVNNLEIHITHSCNLSCESCSHFSNHRLSGKLSISNADIWISQWSKKIDPKTFSILGGEPALHPQMTDFLILARRYWPKTHLRLVTNGFFLHRHPNLPVVLSNDSNACLYISLHHESHEYIREIDPILDLVGKWKQMYGINVEYYESFKYWTKRYMGFGKNLTPYKDKNPEISWQNCRGKDYLQLHEGKLWKCAPLAYLPLMHKKYGLSNDWEEYLQYIPLDIDCKASELLKFVNLKSEKYCEMCAANPLAILPRLPFRYKK